PGIPMLFQGQEFLEPGSFNDATPLDWDRCNQHAGIVQLHRDLIGLRLNRGGHTRGLCGAHVSVYHTNEGGKVLAFHRWDKGGPRDDVVVVANFSHRAYHDYLLGFPREGRWRLRFNSDWQGYSSLFGGTLSGDTTSSLAPIEQMPFRGRVAVGPYAV